MSRLLAMTQTGSLPMFYDLAQALGRTRPIERTGFYVAGRLFFDAFRRRHPEIDTQLVVKEWEIVQRGLRRKPDMGRLRAYEAALGDPTLWGAIIGDRRISMGRLCTLRQDYAPRFSHEQMLGIIDEGLVSIERLFDELQPDAVLSFICVTFGEYLAYLIAKARGIRYLSLRSTRVENFVTFAPTVFEPSEWLIEEYRRRYHAVAERPDADDRAEDRWDEAARRYLSDARGGVLKYEGVVPVSRQAMKGRPLAAALPSRAAALLQSEWQHWFQGGRDDNQVPDPLATLFYSRLRNPIGAARVNRALAGEYLSVDALSRLDYAFYPLHTEPEMSLAIQSRPYLNQLEVLRNIAQSLPVGWIVAVKEHPASMGKRPLSYYRKLLQIPNVRLIDPGLSSREIVERARLVTTVSGSIGFEAMVRRIPVICLGHVSYEMLPAALVRRVRAYDDLATEIRDITADYRGDEAALVAYVGASMAVSERVNLYSNLLRRQGVHVPDVADADGRTDLDRLVALTGRSLDRPLRRAVAAPAAADALTGAGGHWLGGGEPSE